VCPAGWTHFNDSCYMYNSTLTDLRFKTDPCQSLAKGANLVTIHSIEENNFVASSFILFKFKMLFYAELAPNSSQFIYLGYFEDKSKNRWGTYDSSKFDFEAFDTDEPNMVCLINKIK
jgi:hypothetical protein